MHYVTVILRCSSAASNALWLFPWEKQLTTSVHWIMHNYWPLSSPTHKPNLTYQPNSNPNPAGLCALTRTEPHSFVTRAQQQGVLTSVSLASLSAPRSSSRETTSEWPLLAAIKRGVRPPLRKTPQRPHKEQTEMDINGQHMLDKQPSIQNTERFCTALFFALLTYFEYRGYVS